MTTDPGGGTQGTRGTRGTRGTLYQSEMCPIKERKFRIENELIHKLEKWSTNDLRMVKKFTRSAAGFKHRKDDIRSPRICLLTSRYLFHEIMGGDSLHWSLERYHFVFDRLRSVRQDLVIADAQDSNSVKVLQICVKFHLVSNYVFSIRDPENFDGKTNFSHMLECLKSVLVLYENLEENLEEDLETSEERVTMSLVYIVLNLGSSHAIQWAKSYLNSCRNSNLVQKGLEMNLCLIQRNFVRMFKLFREMPLLGQLAFHWNIPTITTHIFEVMSVAYKSKVLGFPISELIRLYSMREEDVRKVCDTLGVRVAGEEEAIIVFVQKITGGDFKIEPYPCEIIEESLSRSFII